MNKKTNLEEPPNPHHRLVVGVRSSGFFCTFKLASKVYHKSRDLTSFKGAWMKRIMLLFLACILALMSSGCVRRIVSIDSQPQGADIYFDRKLIGKTPFRHEFLYYGGHHLELVKKDYRNIQTTLKLKGPLYEFFPLSIFSELLIPWEITDMHAANYTLEKGEARPPIITPVKDPQAPLSPIRLEHLKSTDN